MRRLLPIIAAFVLVLLIGTVHGLWTHRWIPSRELEAAQARLERVSMTIGDWDGATQPVNPQIFQEALIGKSLVRRYVNRVTGEVVTLYVACGRPGPLSVHLPTVCYGEDSIVAPPVKQKVVTASGRPAEFWSGKFNRRSGAVPFQERVYWSFSPTGTWEAADSPRTRYPRYPYLYKIYVTRQLIRDNEKDDPCLTFISVLAPELERALFSESPPSPSSAR